MNTEQSVLDAIDALERDGDDLVDWQLSRRAQRSGYDHNVNQERCTLCEGEWHGFSTGYCPGAWATAEQRAAFAERQRERRPRHIVLTRPRRNGRSPVWGTDWTQTYDSVGAMGLFQQQESAQWQNPMRVTPQDIWDAVAALDVRLMPLPQYPPVFSMFPSEATLARLRREDAPPVQPLDPGQPLSIESGLRPSWDRYPLVENRRRSRLIY